jgi:hypothetical protein
MEWAFLTVSREMHDDTDVQHAPFIDGLCQRLDGDLVALSKIGQKAMIISDGFIT